MDALNDVMAKLPATMDAVAQLQQQLNSVASFLGNVDMLILYCFLISSATCFAVMLPKSLPP